MQDPEELITRLREAVTKMRKLGFRNEDVEDTLTGCATTAREMMDDHTRLLGDHDTALAELEQHKGFDWPGRFDLLVEALGDVDRGIKQFSEAHNLALELRDGVPV